MDLLAQILEEDAEQDGELPAGFLFASIKNTGDAQAVVNGVALEPGEAKAYPFVGKGYQAISYELGESELRILYIV
ncbi:MAG: hypothetical protein ABJQ69_03590 [Ekhidna sp.]